MNNNNNPPLFFAVPSLVIVGKKLILKKLFNIPKYKLGFNVKVNKLLGFSLIKIFKKKNINFKFLKIFFDLLEYCKFLILTFFGNFFKNPNIFFYIAINNNIVFL